MKKAITISLTLVLLLGVMAGAVSAYGEGSGTIRGAVYQDVNGDGKTDGTDQSLVLGAFDKVTESTESADDQP